MNEMLLWNTKQCALKQIDTSFLNHMQISHGDAVNLWDHQWNGLVTQYLLCDQALTLLSAVHDHK